MPWIADLHIHSLFSRATSQEMNLEGISRWARWKGIKLVGTGDFTHPEWLKHLKQCLKRESEGIFSYGGTYFMLSTEVSNIFPTTWGVKKIHNVILSPDFEEVEKLNREFARFGKLSSDGRPILSLDVKRMMEIIKKSAPSSVVIPAHIWTPHFSLFGSESGFNRIEDCFGEFTGDIFALETGLSSDPPMNWRWSALDRFILVSNSDAHSPSRLGREANVFDVPMDFPSIIGALKEKKGLLYTIEFFPQEGKYHYDGHRKCGIRLSPRESILHNNICPVCGRLLTIGVMHRVEEMADREDGVMPPQAIPYKHLIPLEEIISQALGVGRDSQQVKREYTQMIEKWGGELNILLHLEEEVIKENFPSSIGEAILNMRKGEVEIEPGYDGVYGEVRIKVSQEKKNQLSLF